VKIAQWSKDGHCFHCDKFFMNGHKLVCKQLFSIEVVDDEDTREMLVDAADPTISIHALTGIHPRSGKTMQLFILVNGVQLMTLLDSGLTHNLVDLEAARASASSLADAPAFTSQLQMVTASTARGVAVAWPCPSPMNNSS
jgi:hypothetical protein